MRGYDEPFDLVELVNEPEPPEAPRYEVPQTPEAIAARAATAKARTREEKQLLTAARRVIRAESRDGDTGWLGVPPSYLCCHLQIDYADAIALLLALEADGFIYDNGNGGRLQRPDGGMGTNRFFMVGWTPVRQGETP